MKTLLIASLLTFLLGGGTQLPAQEPPAMPAPAKEHEWLQQFVGDWEAEAEVFMEPGKPPIKSKSTETVRSVGGFWVVGESKGDMMGMPFFSMLTLGYNPETKKYVGSWIDSMTSIFWKYEGTVDASGKILTLETEGPCPMSPGKLSKFKEVTEFKSKDHRVFTSSVQGEDGKWTTIVTVNSRRKQ